MGLCKCPKRKVTNLFCFEHRVNVCEHCLVSNHPNCVVQSYLNWLQDSDYNPTCLLCSERLDDEAYSPCTRLMCYDLFHWACLNRYAISLPATTAPAGYQCPKCKAAIFPATNVVSPVADKLKDFLTRVNWARVGLGLPLTDKQQLPEDPPSGASSLSQSTSTYTDQSAFDRVTPSPSDPQLSKPVHPVQPTLKNMGSSYTQPQLYSRTSDLQISGSPLPSSHVTNMSADHDADKYKRRPALSFLSQWFRTHDIGNKSKVSTKKRFFAVVVIGLVGFLTILVIFSRLSQGSQPELEQELMENLNIRVADGEIKGT
ncbi:zinc finger protein-like 1 [Watersipora subatra]|uniref:zinc finger protein-like 1 n=1 Tax=Watersipora subatra TaxID=2589382 RepID=UPI00355AEF1C